MELPDTRLTPWIIGVTAGVWIFLTLAGWNEIAAVAGGFIPARLSGAVVLDGAVPALLTPLTATLLHADVIHLAFNMLMLGFCGRFVESAVGSKLLLALYVAGALAAAFAQYLFSPMSQIPMIGASGAISAVVGSYAMVFSQQKVRAIGPFSPLVVRIVWLALAWMFVQSLIGLATYGSFTRVAIAAHVGGFVAGLVLARPLLLWRYRSA